MVNMKKKHIFQKDSDNTFTGSDANVNAAPHQNEAEAETEGRCGFFTYRPDWMQVFNNSKFLLFLVSGCSFIQSFVVNGINNVNTTAYERRFGLPSSQVGLISSCYDISAGILVLPISYFTLHSHKHVVLGVAVGVLSLGSFLMWLPHFTTGLYEWGDGVVEVCNTGNSTAICTQTNANLSYYLYVLIAAQLLHGVGGTTLYSVGISCLDDCVTAKSSPIYVSIMYSLAALGPAVGYILGGYLLNIYVDFDKVDSTPLTTDDPRWVGAWWLGPVIAMVLALVMFVPFLALPREIPGTKEAKASRVSEAHNSGKDENVIGTSLKDFPKATWMLLRNPTFMLLTIAASTEGIAVSGYATFTPKFIQNQFGQTAGFSAILTGIVAVPGAAGGYLVGGFLCRKFKLTIVGISRLCALSCLIALVSSSVMWSKCDGIKLAGVTADYWDGSIVPTTANLIHTCNSGCGCTQENYSPVCGSNGFQYFSSCHAGCTEEDGENYKSCSCVNATTTANQTAVNGVCETSCPLLYVFLPIFFILMLSTFIPATLVTMATLRCVPASHKTFALGLQWIPGRFLGTVPGPILFGAIIDSACRVWKRSCESSENESCWIYDNFAMGRNFFLAAIGVKILSSSLFFAASLVYKPPIPKNLNTGDNSSDNELNNISVEMDSHIVKKDEKIEGIENTAFEL